MINKVNIILTHNCNLRCKHCYIEAKYSSDSVKNITKKTKNIINKLKKAGVNNLMFTGGECTLIPNLLELIKYAKKLGLIVTIFTNGMIFNKKIFDVVDYVNLSLDGPKDIHNNIRQNNKSYDNVLKVLKYLKLKDKHTTIQYTINKKNIKEIEFIAKLALEYLNIRTIKLVFVSSVGRAIKNGVVHDENDISYIYSKLDDLYKISKYHTQFVPNVITKYDFKNYYLTESISFPLWVDITKEKYYVLAENLLGEHCLKNFDISVANDDLNKLFKILNDNKVKIMKNKYINIENELLEICKGE